MIVMMIVTLDNSYNNVATLVGDQIHRKSADHGCKENPYKAPK